MILFFCKVSNAGEAFAANAYTLRDIQRAYQEYKQKESELLEEIGTFRPRGEWESESAYAKEKMAHDMKRNAVFNDLSFPLENSKFKLRMNNCYIVQEQSNYHVDDQQLTQFNIKCRESIPWSLSDMKNDYRVNSTHTRRTFGGHSYTLRLPSGEQVTYSLPIDRKILMFERLQRDLSGTVRFKSKSLDKILTIFGVEEKNKHKDSFTCPIEFAKFLKPLIAIGSPVDLELDFSNNKVQNVHVIYKDTKILSVK
jgi:hypothetical protein